MLLAEASQISLNLRHLYSKYMTDAENRSRHFQESLNIIGTAVRNAIDDLNQLIEIFYPEYSKYPRQFVSFRELREDICKKLSISPLVWDESLAGKPLVPLLSLESPEYGGDGLTVKQAMNLMSRIKDEGFFGIASKLNEKEALLFWSRATDERPPLPINRFLQLVSYLTEGHAQSLQSIGVMLQTMHPAEIMQKILGEQTIDLEVRTMQPGQPFIGPLYKAWDKLVTPTDVYIEVVSKPRRYLHITEFPKGKFKGVLYNRDKQVVGKVTDLPYSESEAIFEVEAEANQVKSITDIYALGEDWSIYKMDYRDRMNKIKSLSLSIPVKEGRFTEASENISHLLENIESTERLRLCYTSGIELGKSAGWMIMKNAFHLHLLVNAIRRDENFTTHIRLSALDGYELYEVGQLELPLTVAQHIRQRLAQQGVLAGQDWMPVDEYALVVVTEMNEFSLEDLRLIKGEIQYLDDNLGYGDVSQLTDLIDMNN